MTFDLGAPQTGCLMLADISGYSRYMGETELMHAQDVVADLLETIVDEIEPTFLLSKLEGDAAFAYADGDKVNPTIVMDTVEAAYFAFKKRLRDIAHSTTCGCDACVRIPSLDLKFFIHDGEYVVRHIARSEELTGPDVILVHRLAKGTSGEKIGKDAYAVYTQRTMDAMSMDPSILGFVPHTEVLSDVGDVEVFVQDLDLRWSFEQERNRVFVTTAEAVYERTIDVPVAPGVVWDYLTDPVKRPQWQLHVEEVLPQEGIVRGVGSVNHCMHGSDVTIEHVADWRPFSYISLKYEAGPVSGWAWTYDLTSADDGTRLSLRLSDPGRDMWEMIHGQITTDVNNQLDALESLLSGAKAGA